MPVHSLGGFGGSNAFVLTVVIDECGLDKDFYLDGIGLLLAKTRVNGSSKVLIRTGEGGCPDGKPRKVVFTQSSFGLGIDITFSE
jgi:hypothetical protein